MIIKTATPLDQVLKQGFTGKAVEMASNYAHYSVLVKMRADIEQTLKLVTGPLYSGEAESLILSELVNALRKSSGSPTTAEVPRAAYQLAAAYALIFDISKISQSKDIANQITLNSLKAQPIIKAFMRRTQLQVNMEDKDGNPTQYRQQVADIWQIITRMMESVVYTPAQNDEQKKNTPLMTLYEATTSVVDETTVAKNAVGVWTNLLGTLRHGKGTPLDRDGRRAYMAMISEILMRIDELIDAAKTETINYTSEDSVSDAFKTGKSAASSTSFVDAYTALYWLKLYLTVIAQYDVIFPSGDVMVQSQAWVLIIKTEAAKLKKVYLDMAQIAMSFDIRTAMHMWKEVRSFYDPLLNKTQSVVSDMDSVWADVEVKADRLLSVYATEQVKDITSSFKAYMEADYLLPRREFEAASDIVQSYKFPIKKDDYYPVSTGKDVLLETASEGERMVSIDDRDMLVPGLAKTASAVETSLAYLKRAREVFQLSEETDDIYHALVPEGVKWENPYALEGKLGEMRTADFNFKDPMQLSYEKYALTMVSAGKDSNTIGSIDWTFTKLLMKPFYKIPQLLDLSNNRSDASRIVWMGLGELPVGDVITAQYVAQPLPACYTATRNANYVNNDPTSYTTIMSGRSGITSSSREMFRKLAAVLEKYGDTYGRTILDALAAVMFVYRKKEGEDWKSLMPTLPTIYGMPTKAMFETNQIKLSSSSEEVVLKRGFRVTIKDVTYAFILHVKMPQPQSMRHIAYPYAKGVYVHIPVLKSVFDEHKDEIQAKMHISLSSGDNAASGSYQITELCRYIHDLGVKQTGGAEFIDTVGWAPFLINLPHMLCSYQEKNDLLIQDTYKKYSLMSVRVRYDDIERAVYVGGFSENPVELLDVEDYEQATNGDDPTPMPREGVKDIPDINPDAAEPKRADKEPAPKPSQMAPDKGTSERTADVSGITKAPVVDPKQPDGLNGGGAVAAKEPEKITSRKVDSDALAGDVSAAQSAGDADDTRSNEGYWKKLAADGSVEDVVKAIACPAGYVPASEEEYRKFTIANAGKRDGDSAEADK